MDDTFKIYIEQLREGHEEKICENLDPALLDLQEKELIFDSPIRLEGVAYLAENELVLHWQIKTTVKLPCSICNELVEKKVQIDDFYHSEPVDEITTGIYNFKDLLRETILIETPAFAECREGLCPKRKEYQKYLKEPSNHLGGKAKEQAKEQEGYRPFAELEWES